MNKMVIFSLLNLTMSMTAMQLLNPAFHPVARDIMQEYGIERVKKFITSVEPLPYEHHATDQEQYEITDERIKETNPFCVDLKGVLKGSRNNLLWSVLRYMNAGYEKNRTAIVCLVYMGANPDTYCGSTWDALSYALYEQDYAVVRYLLMKGASRHKINHPNCYDEPPIYMAKSMQLAQLLIKYGANPICLSVSKNGETVLHRSMHYEYTVDLVRYYIEHSGLSVNVLDDKNNTPLHRLANSFIKNEAVREKMIALLQAGADYTIKNKDGHTPMDVVIASKFKWLFKMFRKTIDEFEKRK